MTTKTLTVDGTTATALNAKLEASNGPDTFVPLNWNDDGTPVDDDRFVCAYTEGTIPTDIATHSEVVKAGDSVTVYTDQTRKQVKTAEQTKIDAAPIGRDIGGR